MVSLHRPRSLARSISATGRGLRERLWIWPLLAALILGAIGWWIRGAVEDAMETDLANELKTILDADVTALLIWLREQESNALSIASDDRVRTQVEQLTKLDDTDPVALMRSPVQPLLKQELEAFLTHHGYSGYAIVDRNGRVLASDRIELIGKLLTNKELVNNELGIDEQIRSGKPTVTRPFKSQILLKSEAGQQRAEVPTMFALAPVRNAQRDVIAMLGLRIQPEADFTRILSVARSGETGETYAFDKNGLMLSQSRFEEQLKEIGLLVDEPDMHSILRLQLRDPQVNMMAGERPPLRRSEQPLIPVVAEAIAGREGVDSDGYRDYRGVPVVGAWRWLPEYGFGVVTQTDVAEAYLPLYILREVFWGLFALLVIAAVAIFVFIMIVSRLQRTVRKAVIEAKQLGQYTLEEKLGAGGMGIVYKARHAFLRRPTAVKLLGEERTTDAAIARFEREVQLTSQLNHPNTIAIYDFGRTPEGVFYYAMEYLDGVPLNELIERFGPQPEGRVIHMLGQICGSLSEAHEVGLIHRDIKPANIILNRRGGIFDFVKVLDFGLVKAVDSQKEMTITASGAITGTPQYLSPEAIERPEEVDARSDLYAVGAVGYYLLTGTPVFHGKNLADICMKQVRETPERPSTRSGRPVSEELEAILLECLAKRKDDRPPSARVLADRLLACKAAGTWTRAEAETWWIEKNPTPGAGATDPTVNSPSRDREVESSVPETIAFDG